MDLLKVQFISQICHPSKASVLIVSTSIRFPRNCRTLLCFISTSCALMKSWNFFERASRLEECVLGRIIPQSDNPSYPLPKTRITLSSLKTLEIEVLFGVATGFLFDHLILPSLLDFVYTRTEDSFPITADELISFFMRSQCMVQTLRLTVFEDSLTASKLIRILERQPSIKSLSLSSTAIDWTTAGCIDNKFFQRFKTKSKPSVFLPNLQDLQISARRAFSWESFADRLESLWSRMKDTESNITWETRYLSSALQSLQTPL
ncbi:hypothetical protein CPB84DRAFT_1496027 [Gymnopilus junonius]|uniref:Uncharacterized protein n=1 Tax=Gymnopilus junonius TaxID=109634 RepID=A0A9P5NXZ4_GYMJU|nr:hypothetical protein CPB84DRAFT_1496027 [Gymnopilus junonius]